MYYKLLNIHSALCGASADFSSDLLPKETSISSPARDAQDWVLYLNSMKESAF